MSGDEVEYCAEAVRKGDRDRWLCALFAPEAARPAVLALLAFNLELARIRDSVREPHMALIRLQWWRDAIGEAVAGAPRRHPVCIALADGLARHEAMASLLNAMIDAREKDIEEMPFVTMADLVAYAEATSGALARGVALAFGLHGADAAQSALALGRGWALVGLVRAAAHQAALRRCPVPAQILSDNGVDVEAWFAGRPGPGAAGAIRAISLQAQSSFAAAHPAALRDAGLVLGGLAILGRTHLKRVARAGHDPFAPELAAASPSDPVRLAFSWLLRRW
jgi:phytoene/squalene synthetase